MANVAKNRVTRWLTLSKFPKGHIRIEREAQAVRLFLEEQVLARHGCVGVTHAAAIHSATVHHSAFKLVQKMLSDDPLMAMEDKRALIGDASKYCEMRDKAIERLKLDVKTKASLASYAFDVTPDDEPPEPKKERWPGIPEHLRLPREGE